MEIVMVCQICVLILLSINLVWLIICQFQSFKAHKTFMKSQKLFTQHLELEIKKNRGISGKNIPNVNGKEYDVIVMNDDYYRKMEEKRD